MLEQSTPSSSQDNPSTSAEPRNDSPDLLVAMLSASKDDPLSVELPSLVAELPPPLPQELSPSAGGGPMRSRNIANAKFHAGKIKRIMQTDREVGKMKNDVAPAVGKAMELFASKFLRACADEARLHGKMLRPLHMKTVMGKNPEFAFLEKILGQYASPPTKSQTDKPILEGDV